MRIILLSSPLFIIAMLLLGSWVFVSCNSIKKSAMIEKQYLVLLEDGENERTLLENYATYSLSNVSRSNRTLNQYQVVFSCSAKLISELEKKLKDDSQVISFEPVTSIEEVKVQSSTSGKPAKVSPIKSK